MPSAVRSSACCTTASSRSSWRSRSSCSLHGASHTPSQQPRRACSTRSSKKYATRSTVCAGSRTRSIPPSSRRAVLQRRCAEPRAASEVAVRIEANELARYPPELEGAIYFCCREALKVAAALGARSVFRVWEADHAFHFEMADGGGSSDLAESDLTELRDRVEALGGSLTIAPGPEAGTRLYAAVPVATSRPRPDRG